MGVASLVSEIPLLSKTVKFPFWTMDYSPGTLKNGQFPFWSMVHGGQKIESAKKIHAIRGWRAMHANQFRWVGPSSVSEILHFLQRQASTVGGRVVKHLIHILGIKLLNIKSQLPCALYILVLYFSAIAITIIIIMKNNEKLCVRVEFKLLIN